MKTNWITFYSYKGGVGRSLALANVAVHLASLGRRVVMIDFDLEAPGLDEFREFGSQRLPGVVEYTHLFLRDRCAPPIGGYVHRCRISDKLDGELWLMPSGLKDEVYADRLHSVDWPALYESGIACPFIENWKKSIEQEFAPDYVFIDSRTGLTDVGGICTLHFPDVVVLMFALNRQNLSGVAAVRRSIMDAPVIKPIEILTVASPIPNLSRETSHALAERFVEAHKLLEQKIDTFIPYFQPAALVERVWMLDDEEFPEPQICGAYRDLASQIRDRLHDGFDFLLEQAEEATESVDISAAQALINEFSSGYPDRAEAFRAIGQLERVCHQWEASRLAFEKALELDPQDVDSLNDLAGLYRSRGDFQMFEGVLNRVKASLEGVVTETNPDLWFSMGSDYMELGLYSQAAEAFQTAVDLTAQKPLSLPLRFNLAEAKRRASGSIMALDWLSVLELVEKSESGAMHFDSNAKSVVVANRLQAIHIAYAVTGDTRTARECLERAMVVASGINSAATVFSVRGFTEVSRSEFIEDTRKMLQAIDTYCLWDGMPLPRISS